MQPVKPAAGNRLNNAMKQFFGMLAGAALAAGVAGAAETAEVSDEVRLHEMQSMLDRIHSNELRRLRLDLDVERLRAEKTRLESDRTRWEGERDRLEQEITNLQNRVSAAQRPPAQPGLYVSLGDAALRPAEGPAVDVPPMTVVEVVAVTNGRLRVLHAGAPCEADPSDFSSEAELLANLESRAERHAKDLAKAQAEADRAVREAQRTGTPPGAEARAAQEQVENLARQVRRARTAIEHVKKALADHRAGVPAAKPQP